MLFSLEVLPAKEGDCLLLHWDNDGKQRLAIIDGGPKGVFRSTLRPRLEEIAKGEQLTIEFAAVSHVDADHISGIDEFFGNLAREVTDNIPGNQRPFRVLRLWHNTFNDILNDSEDALYKKIQASLTAAGEPTPAAKETITESAKTKFGNEKGEEVARDVSLILAGHAQGRSLRDAWQVLRDNNATGALNAPFQTGAGTATLIASHLTPESEKLEGLEIQIVGPLKEELDALQEEFDTFIEKEGLTVDDVLAAYADESIPNLSSIVCVLSRGDKRMLLTGDARGDKILLGLKKARLLNGSGAHFDILKVPHHGSDRNTEAGFFENLTADTYVLSADGKYENPDRDTVEWIIDSRKKTDKYTIVFTYKLADIDKKRKEEAIRKGKPWSNKDNGIVALIRGKKGEGFAFDVVEGGTLIDLGDEEIEGGAKTLRVFTKLMRKVPPPAVLPRSEPQADKIRIYREIVDFVLFGVKPGAKSRLFADGGPVVAEIWFKFANDLKARLPVLIAPADDANTYILGAVLHKMLMAARKGSEEAELPGISPLDSYLSAKVAFDELISILVPLTAWWVDLNLDELARIVRSNDPNSDVISPAIFRYFSREKAVSPPATKADFKKPKIDEATPFIILTGLFLAVRSGDLKVISRGNADIPLEVADIARWFGQEDVKQTIAQHATQAFNRPLDGLLQLHVNRRMGWQDGKGGEESSRLPPKAIQRIFLDREAELAVTDAKATIKADAAETLFNVDCGKIAWAVIDSGVDVLHPAFKPANSNIPTRFRGIYDFSEINKIITFDLLETRGLRAAVASFAKLDQQNNAGRSPAESEAAVEAVLKTICTSLQQQLKPDWKLVEMLVKLTPEAAPMPESNHGTHVAGILGASWQDSDHYVLGICPNIVLYDFRVIPRVSDDGTAVDSNVTAAKITESSLIATLEFIQYLNTRQVQSGLQIHGVNISLSIPHDVRNYGCGATPVCVACDKLVGSGVVVVAAAGNFGWRDGEGGFGQFLSSSITDPGNAREAITVGSTHKLMPHTYGVSYFSGRGPTGDGRLKPDIVAPGEKITAPVPGEQLGDLTGTSMAAPMVSGAAAILLARHRELIGNPRRVKDILCKSATDLERERQFQGHGLVDVLRALQSV